MPSVSIEFLGTGTSTGVPMVGCSCPVCRSTDPFDKRLRCAALVRVGAQHLLIDAGPDLRQQLLRSNVDRLDAVLLTHEHMDHVAGIDDLRALNFKQRRAMDLYGNAATNAAVRRVFNYAFMQSTYPGIPELVLHDVVPGPFSAGGVEVRAIEVMHHHMPVLGFRIGGLAYITDAKTIGQEAMEQLRGVDVLVLNALREKEHLSHLNLAEAMAVVEQVAPRQALFTHISHLMGTHKEVGPRLPQGVALAHDGLRVEVR